MYSKNLTVQAGAAFRLILILSEAITLELFRVTPIIFTLKNIEAESLLRARSLKLVYCSTRF